MTIDLINSRLIELRRTTGENKDVRVTTFSENESQKLSSQKFSEIIPLLLEHGFVLVSESHTSYDVQVLYFHKPIKL